MDSIKLEFSNIVSKFSGTIDDATSQKIKMIIAAGLAIPVSYYVLDTLWGIYIVRFRLAPAVDKLPGPPFKLFSGTLHAFPGSNEKGLTWFVEQAEKYKTMFRTWQGPLRPTVHLIHPQPIKELLRTTQPKLGMNNNGYRLSLPWLGRGLLISDGRQWARNRRLLTPAFHFDVLKPYAEIYNECAEKLCNLLLKKRETEESVDIFGPVSLATLQTVLKCAFSYTEDVMKYSGGENHPYVNAVTELTALVIKRAYKPHLGYDWIYACTSDGRRFKQLCKYVHNVADEVIDKRQRQLITDSSALQKKYLDFLDILLSARDSEGKGLSPMEIRQEVDTFLFEGHDTTASGISWILYSLAQHPEIQERARQEVREALSGKDSDNFEWDDFSKLPYLGQCIKEGMRVHCPVPGISRDLNEDMTLGGVTVRKYTRVHIHIWSLHHNVHVWGKDHMEFKPERFDPDRIREMDPHAFIPFSAGPRNCIGQNFAMSEMKAIIGKLLNRFKLEADDSNVPQKKPQLIMKSTNGIKIKLTPI